MYQLSHFRCLPIPYVVLCDVCLDAILPWFWQVLIPHKDDVKIESLAAFRDYLVVFQRINGLQVILCGIKHWQSHVWRFNGFVGNAT